MSTMSTSWSIVTSSELPRLRSSERLASEGHEAPREYTREPASSELADLRLSWASLCGKATRAHLQVEFGTRIHRPARPMPVAIVTGSGGLIGSESVRHL